MSTFGPAAGHLRSAISALFLVLALILVCSGASRADSFAPGFMTTHDQDAWSDDPTAVALLVNNYNSVYSSSFGVVQVGLPDPGFSIQFTDSAFVLDYLPATGPPGALNVDLIDPLVSSSNAFGGEVLALTLNINFSAVGLLPHTSAIPFGSLVLTGLDGTSIAGLDGLTVSQVLAIDNTALGGGSTGYGLGGFSELDGLDSLTADLNSSFGAGGVSDFADAHLTATNGNPTPMPEPSSVLLLACGLLGLGMLGGWQRRRGMTIRYLSV